MPRVAVFVTDSMPVEARSILSDFEVFESRADDETLGRCEALVCWPSRAKGETLKKMKNLRMVQTLSAGVDALDIRSLPPGTQVFSNAGAYTENVAEHAWGLLLGVAKGIHVRERKTVPLRLRGKNLLVVGCGAIGSEVARLSQSLGMKVVGVSRSFRSPELYGEMHPLSELADAIPAADAVVITLPLTNKTRGIVNYSVLSKAKDAVTIVNVGRGETVIEEDLIRWLRERPESRFATDVFWVREGRESFATPAWGLPNFAGTLHVSGLPHGEDLLGAKVAAAWNVKRYFETGDAVNRVDIGEYL